MALEDWNMASKDSKERIARMTHEELEAEEKRIVRELALVNRFIARAQERISSTQKPKKG
jgi:hypothetical protein